MAVATVADTFTLDEHGDRNSDSTSRYGVYLSRAGDFDADDGIVTDPAEFAAGAFRVASSPNMSPGYLLTHERVLSASVYRAVESRGLVADVMFASCAPPPALRDLPGWSGWGHERGRPVAPSEASLVWAGSLMTSIRALFLVGADRLYVPVDAAHRLTVEDAKACLLVLVATLNAELAPVLDALEGGR
jgi:hypothetical protein